MLRRSLRFIVLAHLGVMVVVSSSNAQSKKVGKPGAIPAAVDLRPEFKRLGLEPISQGQRNTCSVCVTTGALEFALSKKRNKSTPLSVEYLNWACNQIIGNQTQDRGQFFHDLLAGFQRYGICEAVDMPYRARFDPIAKPTAKAIANARKIQSSDLRVHWINPWKPKPGLTDEHLMEIKTVLARGWPVAAGSSHSRLLVSYRDDTRQPGGGVFIAKDSGIAGYNEITYEFVKANVGDVFWIDVSPKKPR